MAHGNSKTTEQYLEWINEHRSGWTLDEEYNGANARIYHICPEGHSNDVAPNVFKAGRQCSHCKTLERLDREIAEREAKAEARARREADRAERELEKAKQKAHREAEQAKASAARARAKAEAEVEKCRAALKAALDKLDRATETKSKEGNSNG